MDSHKNDRTASIIFTVIGAYLGCSWGSRVGDYYDRAILGLQGSSYYWSPRLALAGLVVGIIVGATIGYLRAHFKNN